jgi:hypothetical protein
MSDSVKRNSLPTAPYNNSFERDASIARLSSTSFAIRQKKSRRPLDGRRLFCLRSQLAFEPAEESVDEGLAVLLVDGFR